MVMKINRKQHSKFIINSAVFIFLFFVLLAATSKLFLWTMIIGWKAQQLLYIPIILGIVGMSWGIYNLSFDPVVKWEKAKYTIILLIGGSVSILLSQISLIVSEFVFELGFFIIFVIFQIVSSIAFSIGFYYFYRDLISLFIRKLVPRNPLPLISIAFLIQIIGYAMFVTSVFLIGYTSYITASSILNIIGMSLLGVFLGFLAVGFYLLFPTFQAFPALADYLEEEINKKTQPKSKSKSK